MPAKSKKQQKFFGMVRAAQKGAKNMSAKVKSVAKSISPKSARDFASTKQKGLPEKKKRGRPKNAMRGKIKNAKDYTRG